MADITLARLRAVKKLQNEIDELEQMKLRWYRPVHSPNMDGMPHSTTPGDPTAQAMHRIDMINDKITGIQQQLADIVEEILNWLYTDLSDDSLEQSELRRIIICHYIDGMSWETTTRHVLGYYGTDSARMRVYRYFNKSDKM